MNNDNECFRWAVLSAVYPADNNVNKVSKYAPFVDRLNWDGLRFPVELTQIRQFERNNVHIRINVYTYKDDERDIIPVYISKFGTREKQVDLLLLKENDRSHYVWIKSMSRLVHARSKTHHTNFVCPHCIHPFISKNAFENHLPDCSRHKRQAVKFPKIVGINCFGSR